MKIRTTPEAAEVGDIKEELKQKVGTYVVDSFHEAQERAMQGGGKRLKTWHVSDFVIPCLRISYYQRLYPQYEMDDQKRAVLYFGTIVHEHSKLSHFHEVTMCYDMRNGKSYTPQEVGTLSDEDRSHILTGTLDDLCKVGDDYILVDKKTYNGGYGFKKTTPDESYKLQLEIYRVLLNASYGIDASIGCLLYLDKSKDLSETPVVFELNEINETKKVIGGIYDQLTAAEVPPGKVCWLCNGNNRAGKIYCDYEDECKREGNRIVDKVDLKK